MDAEKKYFGTLPDLREVQLITLRAGDLELSVSEFGAGLTALKMPSASGGTDDILLGCADFDGYANNRYYFGVTVGRFANRICGAKFHLDGREYRLSANKSDCSLHGGREGFSKKLWHSEVYSENDGIFVRLELYSPDGDQGYPGNLDAAATYGVTKDNCLVAVWEGKTDAPCPVNITNHSYFNLSGQGKGADVLSTLAKLYCSSYVEVDESLMPTGKILPVGGTPLDFRSAKAIGRDILPLRAEKIGGYDHCMVVDGTPDSLRPFGEFFEPSSGRSVKGYTTLPGIQFYTANMLGPVQGKCGAEYKRNWGFCIEPEYFPDSPNQTGFPNAIFGPERAFEGKAVLRFDW